MRLRYLILIGVLALFIGCTQETQNKLSRSIQNWTGTKGTLEIYSGGKVVKRFIDIDKLTTATGTDTGKDRPYRYGYGYNDKNLNGQKDEGEHRVYFEFSDYSTEYIFFEDK